KLIMQKITFYKIFKTSFPLITTNIFIVSVFYYWFRDDLDFSEDSTFLLSLLILITILLLPQLILILNHWNVNKDTQLTIYQNYIVLSINNKQIILNEDTLKSWELVGTSSKLINSSIKFSLLDDLFYLKIELKEANKEIVLTSLLYSKIDTMFQQLFPNKRVENRRKFYPLIK